MTCFQLWGTLEVGYHIIFQTATFQAPERFIDLDSERKALALPNFFPSLSSCVPACPSSPSDPFPGPASSYLPVLASGCSVLLQNSCGRHPPPCAFTQLPGLVDFFSSLFYLQHRNFCSLFQLSSASLPSCPNTLTEQSKGKPGLAFP